MGLLVMEDGQWTLKEPKQVKMHGSYAYKVTLYDPHTGHMGEWSDTVTVPLERTRCGESYKDGARALAEYMWDEGNYSCDCNRMGFLYGWPNDENKDWTCSEGRIDAVMHLPKQTP